MTVQNADRGDQKANNNRIQSNLTGKNQSSTLTIQTQSENFNVIEGQWVIGLFNFCIAISAIQFIVGYLIFNF